MEIVWVFDVNTVLIKTRKSTTEVRKTNEISSVIQIIKILKPRKVQCCEGQRYVTCVLIS